jgi:hypothetical protein
VTNHEQVLTRPRQLGCNYAPISSVLSRWRAPKAQITFSNEKPLSAPCSRVLYLLETWARFRPHGTRSNRRFPLAKSSSVPALAHVWSFKLSHKFLRHTRERLTNGKGYHSCFLLFIWWDVTSLSPSIIRIVYVIRATSYL